MSGKRRHRRRRKHYSDESDDSDDHRRRRKHYSDDDSDDHRPIGNVRRKILGFDEHEIIERKAKKRRIHDKIFPNNYIFEEKVVIIEKKEFIKQFMIPEIFDMILSSTEFNEHLLKKMKKEHDIMREHTGTTIKNIKHSIANEVTRLTTKINDMDGDLKKLSLSHKEVADGFNDQLKKIKATIPLE